jgi:NitT/TauT family transport system permease protein
VTRRASRARLPLWSLASIAVLLLVWQVAAWVLPPIVLPSPLIVARAFAQLVCEPAVWFALAQSLGAYAIGFSLAAAAGAILGVASGLSRRAARVFAPGIGLMNSVPTVAWMGLAMIWFGLGLGPTVFLVVITSTPILAAALAGAIENRDTRFDELARVFELPARAKLRHITLPPLLGSAHAALSSMAGLGWKLTIMGEFLTASRGLGESLVVAKAHMQTDRVIAITALLVLVWAIVDAVLRFLASPKRSRAKARNILGRKDSRPASTQSVGAPLSCVDEQPEPVQRETTLLRCVDLSLGHGSVIAQHLSFTVKQGEVLAVLGTSGIGKSSLLNVMCDLQRPVAGHLERAACLRSSYVFQDDRLLPWRTVEENVAILAGATTAAARSQLEKLGLADSAAKLPGELSGGMRRRAALARGFLRSANLLLLDEPFAGLDPLRRVSLIAEIEQMRREFQQAIVLVTHEVDDAVLLADEAIVLGGGKPATVTARFDLRSLTRHRSLNDVAASAIRSQILEELLHEIPAVPGAQNGKERRSYDSDLAHG